MSSDVAPRIFAIDLAETKTGMCYFDDALERPVLWTFDTERRHGHDRENAIKAEISAVFASWMPEIVLLEKLPPRITPGLIGLAFLHGVIRNHLDSLGPYVEVSNSHIKIYGVGKGNGVETDKIQLTLAVDRRYPHLVTVEDHNQADAFLLLALGRHAYGHPLATVDGKKLPDTHLRVLKMLAGWPALDAHQAPAGPDATTSRRPGRAKS